MVLLANLVVPTSSPVTSDCRVHGWEWLASTLRVKATLGGPPRLPRTIPEHTNGTRPVLHLGLPAPPPHRRSTMGVGYLHPSPAKLPMLARPQSDLPVSWVGPHQAGAYLSNCLNQHSLGKTASHPQWKTNHRGSSLEIPNKLLSQDRGMAQESLTFLLDREAEGIEQWQFTWIGDRRID